MAKAKPKTVSRRQVARREKETEFQQLMMWIAIGVISLIVIIVGYGLIAETVAAQKPVARIYDESITTKSYRTRQMYERTRIQQQINEYAYYQQLYQGLSDAGDFLQQLQLAQANLENQLAPGYVDIFAKQVLDGMLEEALVRHEAQARGLAISQDEVNLRIEELLGYDREAAASITDTTSIPNYADYYAMFKLNILDASGFTEKDFRTLVQTQLLKEQLMDTLVEVETTAEQIEGTLFMLTAEEAALALQWRINQGAEDITEIAEEINQSETGDAASFTIPWMTANYLASNFGPDVERAAWNTEVGQAAAPVSVDAWYYVFYVAGREVRPLEDSLIQTAKEQQYYTWLETQLAEQAEYLDNWQNAIVK